MFKEELNEREKEYLTDLLIETYEQFKEDEDTEYFELVKGILYKAGWTESGNEYIRI